MISIEQSLFFGDVIILKAAWWERRWSPPHWWWRSQWGVPWCLQWDSAGPPSWSSCLSRCRQRWPCQSRSPPVAGLRGGPLCLEYTRQETTPFNPSFGGNLLWHSHIWQHRKRQEDQDGGPAESHWGHNGTLQWILYHQWHWDHLFSAQVEMKMKSSCIVTKIVLTC